MEDDSIEIDEEILKPLSLNPNNSHSKSFLIQKFISVYLISAVLIGAVFALNFSREKREREVVSQIHDNWGWNVKLGEPMLTLNGQETPAEEGLSLYPSIISVKGGIDIQTKRRDIYRIPLYSGELDVKIDFTIPKNYWEDRSGESEVIAVISANFPYGGIISLNDCLLNGETAVDVSWIHNANSFSITLPAETFDRGTEFLSLSYTILVRGSKRLEIDSFRSKKEVEITFSGVNASTMKNIRNSEYSYEHNGSEVVINWNSRNRSKRNSDTGFVLDLLGETSLYRKANTLLWSTFFLLLVAIGIITFLMHRFKNEINFIQLMLIATAIALCSLQVIALGEILGYTTAYIVSSLFVFTVTLLYLRRISSLPMVPVAIIYVASYGVIYIFTSNAGYAFLSGTLFLTFLLVIAMIGTVNLNKKADQ